MTDPVGSSRLEGAFTAQVDSERTMKILSDLKSVLAAASSGAPALSSVR